MNDTQQQVTMTLGEAEGQAHGDARHDGSKLEDADRLQEQIQRPDEQTGQCHSTGEFK